MVHEQVIDLLWILVVNSVDCVREPFEATVFTILDALGAISEIKDLAMNARARTTAFIQLGHVAPSSSPWGVAKVNPVERDFQFLLEGGDLRKNEHVIRKLPRTIFGRKGSTASAGAVFSSVSGSASGSVSLARTPRPSRVAIRFSIFRLLIGTTLFGFRIPQPIQDCSIVVSSQ